jgi:hypothetical protein
MGPFQLLHNPQSLNSAFQNASETRRYAASIFAERHPPKR